MAAHSTNPFDKWCRNTNNPVGVAYLRAAQAGAPGRMIRENVITEKERVHRKLIQKEKLPGYQLLFKEWNNMGSPTAPMSADHWSNQMATSTESRHLSPSPTSPRYLNSKPIDYAADSSALRGRVFASTQGGKSRTKTVKTTVRSVDQDALRQVTLIDYVADNIRRNYGQPLPADEGFSFISGLREELRHIQIDHILGVDVSDEPVDVIPLTTHEHTNKSHGAIRFEHVVIDGKKVGIHVTLHCDKLKRINYNMISAREGKIIMFPPEVMDAQAAYEARKV